MKLKLNLAILVFFIAVSSCKKSPVEPEVPVTVAPGDIPTPPVNSTRTQLTLDSIYLYARETYLWNDALPNFVTFNPRGYNSFSTPILNFQDELFDITQLKIDPKTAKPYEFYEDHPSNSKFSYIMDDTNSSSTVAAANNKFADVTIDGEGDDFGLDLASLSASDVRVKKVSPGSPAALKGVVRADRILKINGTTVSAGSQSGINFIYNSLDGNTIKINAQRINGTQYTVDLVRNTYQSSSILKKTVLTSGSKKIGYLAYARFSNLPNSKADLEAAFADFASQGITDLIVDFRYNGGGYVETAEYMTNLIAPSAKNGAVMYVEFYNSLMQSGKAAILSHQILLNSNGQTQQTNGHLATYADIDYSVAKNTYKFEKAGTLNNIKNVVFIVSKATASASELVINSLKPHMNVKLVGSKTYGKPVGFFPIGIDKFQVYMSNFSIQNSIGEGGYFAGMSVDIPAADDLMHDFGSAEENCIAKAMAYITTGTTVSAVKNAASVSTSATATSSENPIDINKKPAFNGMIETRKHLK